MFVWPWRVGILILAGAGTFCIIDSFCRNGLEFGIYAAKDKRYFIELNNRQIWFGVAERKAFPWRNPDGPFDDTNVAGAPETAPFAPRWKFGRIPPGDWVPWFADPDRPHYFSTVTGDFESAHLNYPDQLTLHGVNLTSRSVGCALLVLPAVFLTSLISRHVLRRHRRRGLRCIHCNYDLRASVDRCPECGAPISVDRAVTASPS